MSESKFNPQYVIHSDEEPLRLERQARMYGTANDLRFLAPGPSDRVLDAGCGSGSMTRAVARTQSNGEAFGLDREPRYIDFARRKAKSEQIENAKFGVGDVLSIPFSDGVFDLVWSKHLLQWVGQRGSALAEFKRVTRPGGRNVCCNFDRFCLVHYPTDNQLQSELETWFAAAEREFGFDTDLGRKLPHMFKAAGLVDVHADFIPDRVFCGFGGDSEAPLELGGSVQQRHAFQHQSIRQREPCTRLLQARSRAFQRPRGPCLLHVVLRRRSSPFGLLIGEVAAKGAA